MTIAYISKLLKLLLFLKKNNFFFLSGLSIKMEKINRKENNIITKNRGIIESLNDIIVDVKQKILVKNY